MATVVVAESARDDLDALIVTHSLPAATRDRVRQALARLAEFPRLGPEMTGPWHGLRFILGPWPWLPLVYEYDERTDQVSVLTIQDSRSARAATAERQALAPMIELSANLELLFGEAPAHAFDERIDRAADAGFRAVEIWWWRNKDLAAISRALTRTGVELATMIVEPMLPIVDPAVRVDALKAIEDSARVAADLGCSNLVITVGDARPGVPRRHQHRAIVETLKAAAPIVEAHGVVLALENLNSRVDHVGTYLDSAIETLDIVDEVGSPHVQMCYDLYHSVVMGESLRDVLAGRLDRVRHIQIADVPGRHEPGTGRIDWPAELGWLVSNGYRGRIGLECTPTTDSVESVRLIRSLVARL